MNHPSDPLSVKDAERYFADRREEHAAWRRHLHQWPELGFEEYRTAEFIAERLAGMGIPFETGIAVTGIVATLEGNQPGPSIGLRADMDALPILEESNLSYRSAHEGVSHSCGHDGHMTMLLAAAEYLAASRNFAGRIHFIFQPAEEAKGGGRLMVEEGLFDRWPVEAVFGLHNWPGLPAGTIAARPGPVMAAMDLFEVTLKAAGVHAALPHLGTDAIVAAGALISNLQTIVSRTIDSLQPTVVSLTQVHGGNSLNALPDEVVLRGTVRSLSAQSSKMAYQALKRIVDGVARTHSIEGALEFRSTYPVTVNDAECSRRVADIAARAFGAGNVVTEYLPSMASEDFAFMLEAKPGCYAWIGSGREVPLHNPAFDFNDALIPAGALYWVQLAQNWNGNDHTPA